MMDIKPSSAQEHGPNGAPTSKVGALPDLGTNSAAQDHEEKANSIVQILNGRQEHCEFVNLDDNSSNGGFRSQT